MSNPRNNFYEFGPFRLDVINRLLLRDGEVVQLKKKAFDTLLVLVENHGQVLEKETLMQRLWPDTFVEESNLTHYIYALRRVLGDEKENPRYIVTIPGRGYRFSAKVIEHKASEDFEAPLLIERHSFARVIITKESDETTDLTTPPIEARVIPQLAPAKSSSQRKYLAGISILVVGGLLFAGYWWKYARGPKSPTTAAAKIVPFTGLAGREAMPAFSPDGRQIVYPWEPEGATETELYVKLLGTGEPVRLTNTPGQEYNPAWSPDGKHIAFLRTRAEQTEIFVMPSLGGNERNLGELQAVDGYVAWTPDGQALVTSTSKLATDKERQALVRIEVESGTRKFLTDPPPLVMDDVPRFSPDGRQLAFRRALNRGHSEIFIAQPDGSQVRQLTNLNAPIHGFAWSADGAEIVLAAHREGSNGLWRVVTKTGAATPVEATGRHATHPALAANGTLAYVDSLEDANIWRIDLTGHNHSPRKFLASRQGDHSPEFSPDGRRIAFSSGRSGHDEIWVCQSDGSNPQQLTHFNGLASGSPHWSPDGKQLVFDARPENHGDLFLINADGGSLQRLTTETSHDVIPSWSQDGKWLYFCSNRSGKLQIWKRQVAGGEAVQLTQQGGMEAFEAPDGKSIYYLKGRGITGLWRVNNDGSNEEPVPELASAGYWRYWTIVRTGRPGLYFLAYSEQLPLQIKHFDFTTRQVKTVVTLNKPPAWLTPGLTVSPDGQQLLYSSNDLFSSSIMVLENFR